MMNIWSIVIVLAIGIAVFVVAARIFQSEQGRKAQEPRAALYNESRSTADYARQREERRLANMSADDRAWEQASLQRQQERELVPHTPPS